MSQIVKVFLKSFVNAFRPIDYTQTKKLGELTSNINNKIGNNRELTLGKINKISEKAYS